MKRLIFLTIGLGIVLGIIIGANVVNKCASAQSSFPMCVTVYKYLIWKDFKEGAIPIGSSNVNELTQSGFEIKSGALKFPAVSSSSVPTCDQNVSGLMYYDKDARNFKCCVKVLDNPPTYGWSNCGGGGLTYATSSGDLVVPVKIWRDANKTFTVLEITEE
jgi:hypothetical protein